MNALSAKMNLDSSVEFAQIADETEGFTGADLQSILYTAQLKAVEDQQLKNTGEELCFFILEPTFCLKNFGCMRNYI